MARCALIPFLLCACSASPSADPDAPDAGAAATIRVVDDGVPVAGVRVVFHDADGEPVAMVRADVDGVATGPLPPGGLVTVAYPAEPGAGPAQLLTYVGLAADIDLTVEIPAFPAPPRPGDPTDIVGSLRIELPALAGASSYLIHLGCIDYETDQRVTVVEVPASCLGADGLVDVTVDAASAPSVSARLGTTFTNGLSVATGSITDVALPAWIETLPTIAVDLAEVPAGITNASAVAVMRADQLPFPPVVADAAAVSAPTLTLSPGFLPEFTRWMDLEIVLHAGTGGLTRRLRYGAPAEPTTYIWANELLPTVSNPVLNDAAITWTNSGSLLDADGMFLHVRGDRGGPRRWTVVAPGDTPSPFALPSLPPELDAYVPAPGDPGDVGVVAFELDWIAGHDDFIANFGLRLLEDPCIPESYAASARLTQAGAFYGPDLRAGGF